MPARGSRHSIVPRAAIRLSRRRVPVLAALVALSLLAGSAAAATPVTNGYRGIAYGGGAARPTSDKPQSKLWFTDGSWFAGMFLYRTTAPLKSEFHIYRLNKTTHDWVDTGTVIDTRDQTHGDYLWHEASSTLWVASARSPGGDDAIKVFRYSYNAVTNVYTPAAGFPKTIQGTGEGGAHTVSIARDSAGHLWAAWPKDGKVMFSRSTDQGAIWSTPAQVPAQVGNSIRGGGAAESDTASVIAFGSKLGIGWSDDDDLPTEAHSGYYLAVIAAGANPAIGGSWTLEKLPSLVTTVGERADNHLNLKAASDGTLYAVGKTRKDTAGCTTNKAEPLVEVFKRTAAGVWSTHLVATVGDCVSRPQLVISEQLGAAWVFLTTPNGGGMIRMKSAPLSGPEALKFRDGADATTQPGIPFIRSATETRIDDVTTTKQVVNSVSGIVALANNVPTSSGGGGKWYLHNELTLPATDTTAPSGTVSVAGGAAFTRTAAVTVNVAATDAGSGPSMVRLSNTAAKSGDGTLTDGKSFTQAATVPWTLSAGDGAKTVYAQWRDAAGNWSAVQSDTIVLDTTGPTGTVSIAGGAAATNNRSVTLSLTANDGGGSGPASVLVSNTGDPAGATPIPFAASIPWTLSAGDGTKTVHVKFVDAVGNVSASAVTDTISLDTTPPTAGSVAIAGGNAVATSRNVSVNLSGAGGDAMQARASNAASMSGAVSVPVSGSFAWVLASGADGPRSVYVQWADTLGNWSAPVSDSIMLDVRAPIGTVRINGTAIATKSTAVNLTFPGTDGDVTHVKVSASPSLSGASFQPFTPGMSLPWTLAPGDGTKTVYAQFKDVGGLTSSVVSDTIILDTVAPTRPGAPVHRLGGPVGSTIPVRLTWTAGADPRSGVKGYIVQRSVNGGAYTTVASPTSRSLDVGLKAATTYRFRVATVDHAGNRSAYVAGASFKGAKFSEASSSIRYRGTWSTTSSNSYVGGKAKFARAKGASATFTFTGKQVAWVALTGPTSGKARVYLNGTYVKTVNLYASTTTFRKIAFSRAWTTSRQRTLRIVVVGTAGHPRVTVDGFFVLR